MPDPIAPRGLGPRWWAVQNIYLRHFRPVGGGDRWVNADKMDAELLLMLDNARQEAGVPFVITSAYRPMDKLSHGKGKAVDIRCHDSMPRLKMVRALLDAGFTRIGVYNLHIHVDVDSTLPQDVMWVGQSE